MQTATKLLPIQAVEDAFGVKKTAIYEWMANGVFPRGVMLNSRLTRWPSHEVEAVIQAHAAELGVEAVRALVSRIHAKREQLASELIAA